MPDAGIVPGEWRDMIPFRSNSTTQRGLYGKILQLFVHLVALTYNMIVNWRQHAITQPILAKEAC